MSADSSLDQQIPYNIEAEQYVLGALLNDNNVLLRIGDSLLPSHFYQEIHAHIYENIIKFSNKSIIATPVTLKNIYDHDEKFAEVKGSNYLFNLANIAVTVIDPMDYAKLIVELYIRRQLIYISQNINNEAVNNNDPMSSMQQIEHAEQKLFDLAAMKHSDTGFVNISIIANIAKNTIETLRNNKKNIYGVSTGFVDIDKLLGGFQNSDLIILAARPSMGKTALAISFAVQISEILKDSKDNQDKSVGFFSLEMSSEQLATRIISMISEVDSHKIRSGNMDNNQFNSITSAAQKIQQLNLFIDDTPSLTISGLRTRARRLKRKNNLAVLFVDYLQLIRASGNNSNDNRNLEISQITQGLKAIAKELSIPVIVLSQLSRSVEQREDKRPQLSDLRDSGSIEQDADIVMFIYRDSYYISRKEPKIDDKEKYESWQKTKDQVNHVSHIIIAKQRNGPIGTVKLHFKSSTTKFTNFIDKV